MYGIKKPSLYDHVETYTYKQWFQDIYDYIVSRVNVKTTTISYTVEANIYYVRADATTGAITITLPTTSLAAGRQLLIKKIDSGVNAVTVAASGSDTIEGAATISLAVQWSKQGLISNGNGGWEKV